MHVKEKRTQNKCSEARRRRAVRLPLEQIAIIRFWFARSHALDSAPRERGTDCVGPKIFYCEVRGIDSNRDMIPGRKSNRGSRTLKSDAQNRLTAFEAVKVLPFRFQRPA